MTVVLAAAAAVMAGTATVQGGMEEHWYARFFEAEGIQEKARSSFSQ